MSEKSIVELTNSEMEKVVGGVADRDRITEYQSNARSMLISRRDNLPASGQFSKNFGEYTVAFTSVIFDGMAYSYSYEVIINGEVVYRESVSDFIM